MAGAGQTYDGRGNLTTGGFSYDVYNRLVAAPGMTSLGYDPAGRLYETVAGGAATRFLYDGDEIIAEYNGSGTLQRRYVPGPGLDEPAAWYEGAGTSDRRWLVQDERGSVIAWANAAGGLGAAYAYDEYGQPSAWGSVGSTPRFRYAGAVALPEAQLYSMRARVYSPTLGRFLQTDPILHAGGLNLYAYVGNDPVNFIDPWGFERICRTTWKERLVLGEDGGPEAVELYDREVHCSDTDDLFPGDQFVIEAWENRFFDFDDHEQFFKPDEDGLVVVDPAAHRVCPSGTQNRPPDGFFDGSPSIGHTHDRGKEPFIGPDDGVSARMAARTGGVAYMVSPAGAFRMSFDGRGYAVARLAGRWGTSESDIRGIVRRWNQNQGNARPGGVANAPGCGDWQPGGG